MQDIRGKLLGKRTPRISSYHIDGFGEVWLRSISELERSRFELATIADGGKIDREACLRRTSSLLVQCLCDEEGKRIFTEADVPEVMEIDSSITAPLFDLCRKHCGIDDETVQSTAKNLPGINGDSLPTE